MIALPDLQNNLRRVFPGHYIVETFPQPKLMLQSKELQKTQK
jgi:hypothetical protein